MFHVSKYRRMVFTKHTHCQQYGSLGSLRSYFLTLQYKLISDYEGRFILNGKCIADNGNDCLNYYPYDMDILVFILLLLSQNEKRIFCNSGMMIGI